LKYLKFHSTLPTTVKDKVLKFEFESEEDFYTRPLFTIFVNFYADFSNNPILGVK